MPYANPKSHIIHSIRDAKDVSLQWLLMEAIDNSLDYEASKVSIGIGEREISIHDDGAGLTKDRISAPLTLGDHRPARQGLGRFGVGITAQAIKHGDTLQIDTISKDGHGLVQADWQMMLKRGDWYYDDPIWRRAVGSPLRTIVTISNLLKIPRPKDIERARDEIAMRFYPALAGGRQIIVDRVVIKTLTEPALTDVVQKTLTFPDGRSARIRGGLLVDASASGLCRVHVSYLHRVIKPNCGFGCDGYSGLENMFARVELSEHWRLTQFKDDVVDSDELEEAVQEVLDPILRKCHARSMTVDLQETIEAVNALLGEDAARPIRKRPPGPRPPPHPPRPPGLKIVPDAQPSSTGPVKKPRPRAKLKIDFPPGEKEAELWGVGTTDRTGRIHRIILPRDNSFIKELLAVRELDKKAHFIHVHAMLIYQQSEPQGDLVEFGRLVWEKVSSTKINANGEATAA